MTQSGRRGWQIAAPICRTAMGTAGYTAVSQFMPLLFLDTVVAEAL